MKTEIPQIDLNKEFYFESYFNMLKFDEKFFEENHVNLNKKQMVNLQMINEISRLLTEVNFLKKKGLEFQKQGTEEGLVLGSNLFCRVFSLQKLCIYLLKRVVDDFISLFYYFSYFNNNSKLPDKILVDCVGSFTDKKSKCKFKEITNNQYLQKIKNNHESFLNIINDIFNAQKHSFVDSEISDLIDWNTNRVYYLKLKDDKNKKSCLLSDYNVEYEDFDILIEDFNKFIKDSYEFLKEFEKK